MNPCPEDLGSLIGSRRQRGREVRFAEHGAAGIQWMREREREFWSWFVSLTEEKLN